LHFSRQGTWFSAPDSFGSLVGVAVALSTNPPCRVVPGLASGTAQGTLPWSWYSDSELLRREQELIFQRGCQYAGPAEHAAEPGYFTCSLGDVPVVATRDRAGELHALLNVCRHRGSIAIEGRGSQETLQCRYHAWTYGLDGGLRAAPRARDELDTDGITLHELAVEGRAGGGGRGAARLRRPGRSQGRVLVESVQAGVRSGLLEEGKLLPKSERLLAHFQHLVREALA
jgi:nitrite reductase/ring-hydroxylating ferredoxin subunit